MAKIRIREIIKMAEEGLTKYQIIECLGISEKEYKSQVSTFSEYNRKKLRGLLIGNAKRKQQTSIPSIPKYDTEVEAVKLLDSSFIVSNFFRYDDEEGYLGTLLPQVYEQLVVMERRGNRKLCRMFHLMLYGMLDIRFFFKSYVPDKIPEGEDPADMEILEYAKVTPGAVVYTCDKRLALRCKQQGINYKYFDNSRQKTNLPII